MPIDCANQSYPNNYYNIPFASSDTYTFSQLNKDLSQALNFKGIKTESDWEVFSGWYTDSALTQEFNAYPTQDVTLYAKFSLRKIIKFELKDGLYSKENLTGVYVIQFYKNENYDGYQEFLENEASNIIPPKGKEFDKWYLDFELTQVYEGTFWPDDDITLYAGYKDKSI